MSFGPEGSEYIVDARGFVSTPMLGDSGVTYEVASSGDYRLLFTPGKMAYLNRMSGSQYFHPEYFLVRLKDGKIEKVTREEAPKGSGVKEKFLAELKKLGGQEVVFNQAAVERKKKLSQAAKEKREQKNKGAELLEAIKGYSTIYFSQIGDKRILAKKQVILAKVQMLLVGLVCVRDQQYLFEIVVLKSVKTVNYGYVQIAEMLSPNLETGVTWINSMLEA